MFIIALLLLLDPREESIDRPDRIDFRELLEDRNDPFDSDRREVSSSPPRFLLEGERLGDCRMVVVVVVTP